MKCEDHFEDRIGVAGAIGKRKQNVCALLICLHPSLSHTTMKLHSKPKDDSRSFKTDACIKSKILVIGRIRTDTNTRIFVILCITQAIALISELFLFQDVIYALL